MTEATTGWALITGASGGIGEAMARLLVERGRKIIISARSADKLEALAEELRSKKNGIVEVIPADLASATGTAELWQKASKDRQISFLINNAGLGTFGAIDETDWDHEELSIDVNVTALTRLCRDAAAHMKTTGKGRILNVASVAGYLPGPGMAVYHATKAYVVNLSQSLREELAPFGVSVTVLCPGPTRTGFFAEAGMQALDFTRNSDLPSARAVAERGYFSAMRGRPIAIQGIGNRFIVFASRLLPATVMAKIVRRFFAG